MDSSVQSTQDRAQMTRLRNQVLSFESDAKKVVREKALLEQEVRTMERKMRSLTATIEERKSALKKLQVKETFFDEQLRRLRRKMTALRAKSRS